MCCGSFWTALHVLWSIVYVICGATQLMAGVFFLLSVPALHLTSNIAAGFADVLLGIAGGILVCFGQLSSRRQEFLLYMAISILTVNIVNVIVTEWGMYFTDMDKLLENHPHHVLILCACLATRTSAAIAILISFLDSQFTFCSMQIRFDDTSNSNKKIQKNKAPRDSHEQVADIEYIIPRQKSTSKCHTVYNAYAQSCWVFDAENNATCSINQSPTAKIVQTGTPKSHAKVNGLQPNGSVSCDTAHLIDNPVVHIEEASDDSTSNSDRKLYHMKSFSQTASPAQLSASSSQISLNNINQANNPLIVECLEKLTEPQIYRSRLNTALSNKEEEDTQYQAPQAIMMRRVESISPRSEKVQYASLMKELQKAIVGKKEPAVKSPSSDNTTRTNSKTSSRHESTKSSSDTEFSKELEAALQLIQDLESPNTVETPSDKDATRPLAMWRHSDATSDSEKTVSALGSLGEIASPLGDCPDLHTFKPSANGKGASILVHYPDSQSTSGYSSPIHPISNGHTPNWSTTSSINGSSNEIIKPVSYSIHNAKSTTVISLYTQNGPNTRGKSVTLVSITGDNQPSLPQHNSTSTSDQINNSNVDKHIGVTQFGEFESKRSSTKPPTGTSSAVWKSLLRKKKHVLPKLCPELEGAIIKSESLAYLSELELLARHKRNKEIHREIEEKVIQQLGVPRTESKC